MKPSCCAARASGGPERWPRRTPKKRRPVRRGVAFWLEDSAGAVLLRRRAEAGLLGGMMEVPSTPWRDRKWTAADAGREAPAAVEWRALPGQVRHVFTHFQLELTIMIGRLGEDDGRAAGVWCPPERLSEQALPTLMKKIAAHAQTHSENHAPSRS